jgi:hypothetical protein
MNRKSLIVLAALAVATLLSACSHSKPIAISLSTAPPSTIEINDTASMAATVTNDSSNAGVDWNCSPSPCGSFNPSHTASGAATVWTAPSTAGSVTITADATAKSSVTATASVTVNPVASVSNLAGTYTYYANGYDSSGDPISVVGNVTFDSTGDITGGEQDYFDTATNPATIITADPITAATAALTVGPDGRGSVTITPTTAPPATLSLTVVNNDHILIEEFDSNATTAGSMDMQTAPTSVPSGGNAFALYDVDDAFVFGGVVTSDGSATLTTGEGDDDLQGAPDYDFVVTGTFTAPDSFGRGTVTFVDPNFIPTFTFDYYVVGPEAFRLIATDGNTFATGSMYGQGSNAGSFNAASLTGSFAFGQQGLEDVGFGVYAAAGQFTTDATSSFTGGVADINEGDGTPVSAGALTGSTYTVAADGYGSVVLPSPSTTDTLANFGVYVTDPTLDLEDPNNSAGGGAAVMLDLDTSNLGAGVVMVQTSGATFVGNFATNDDGSYEISSVFSDYDFVGQGTSDGSANFDGTVDYNDLLNTGLNPAVSLAVTFAADTANPGRATGQSTLNGSTTPVSVTFYQASNSLTFHVDMDSAVNATGDVGFGVAEQQQ